MQDPVYLNDKHVLSRMLASETRHECQHYFNNGFQQDFDQQDRRVLAIWMRDVCQAEECQPDIFPLSIRIMDTFLSIVRTQKSQLQLLGSVALLVASKLRQTTQIPTKHLIYYTHDLITVNELKSWELLLLTTLKWDLAMITAADYLDIFIKLEDEHMSMLIEDEALRLIYECCLGKLSFQERVLFNCSHLFAKLILANITTDANITIRDTRL